MYAYYTTFTCMRSQKEAYIHYTTQIHTIARTYYTCPHTHSTHAHYTYMYTAHSLTYTYTQVHCTTALAYGDTQTHTRTG